MPDKPRYQPPRIVNLSTFDSCGQVGAEGWCSNGGEPAVNTCTDGSSPTQEDLCSPTGLNPTRAGCLNGTNVLSLCTEGSLVTES